MSDYDKQLGKWLKARGVSSVEEAQGVDLLSTFFKPGDHGVVSCNRKGDNVHLSCLNGQKHKIDRDWLGKYVDCMGKIEALSDFDKLLGEWSYERFGKE